VLRHQIDVTLAMSDAGAVTTTVTLAGALLADPHEGRLPVGLDHCWDNLDPTDMATDRVARLGTGLFTALFDESVARRLVELIETSPLGTTIDLTFHLTEPLAGLPVELLRMPAYQRLLATIAGLTIAGRLAGINRAPVDGLAGPSKMLAAVAAVAASGDHGDRTGGGGCRGGDAGPAGRRHRRRAD
jgi:hypothetical protein